jgi:hypothetical protein
MQTAIRVILLAALISVIFAISGQDVLKAEPVTQASFCDREWQQAGPKFEVERHESSGVADPRMKGARSCNPA